MPDFFQHHTGQFPVDFIQRIFGARTPQKADAGLSQDAQQGHRLAFNWHQLQHFGGIFVFHFHPVLFQPQQDFQPQTTLGVTEFALRRMNRLAHLPDVFTADAVFFGQVHVPVIFPFVWADLVRVESSGP